MDAGDEDEEMDLPLISTHLYGFILLGCMRAVATGQWKKRSFGLAKCGDSFFRAKFEQADEMHASG